MCSLEWTQRTTFNEYFFCIDINAIAKLQLNILMDYAEKKCLPNGLKLIIHCFFGDEISDSVVI